MKKICHITSVHAYNDVRIFVKECSSLAASGYETHLIAPHAPNAVINDVIVEGVTNPNSGRLYRMARSVFNIYKKAKLVDADVYHFHDPELLPVGIALKKYRHKKIIYDMHENVPDQILDKEWINKKLRKIISIMFSVFENYALKIYDAIVLAETSYLDHLTTTQRCTVIRNYPIISEFNINHAAVKKECAVCYVGSISKLRGVREMVEAIGMIDVKLILVGDMAPELHAELRRLEGWKHVEWTGRQDRISISTIMKRAIAGLVVLHPIKNYIRTEPTKMFEYMAAGIPFICSNFPEWVRIIHDSQCGICVDPLNTTEIAAAIQRLVDNPDGAICMGRNGRKAVEMKYSWETEQEKLLTLYNTQWQ